MRKNIIQNLAVFLFVVVTSLTNLKAQTADFTVNDSSGCGTLTAIFQDQSTPQGSIVGWLWDFGDSTSPSILQNPVHIYAAVGCYDVTLTVTYSSGATQTITKPDFVCVHALPGISVSNASFAGCSPLLVDICDLSTNMGGTGSQWIWDIPNQNLQTDSCLNVVVSDPGVYDVTFVVTNSFGCISDSIFNDIITVQPSPVVDFTTATASSTCNNPPLILDFQNQTTLNGLTNPTGVTYNWAFPGATSPAPPTSTLSNPLGVTYSAAGNYDVTLIASTSLGCADTLTQIDFVSIGPIVADFNIPTTICVGQPATFTNNSSGGANTFSWDRSCDGTINGLGANYTTTFPTVGTFCLRLIAKNPAEGCSDTVEQTITVNPVPTADFVVDRVLDCEVPSTFTFDDNSANAGAGATYSWDFGANATPPTTVVTNTNAINVTFNAGGTQDIALTVENSFGCKNTQTKNAFINIAPPAANFNAIKREGCIPFSSAFTSTATPTGAPYTPYTYEWVVDPPGGVTFAPSNTVSNPTITFADTGKYDITLIVTTPGGCKDTVTKNNFIKTGTLPVFDFMIDDTDVCVKQEIQFNCVPTDPLWKYSWDFKYDGTFNSQSTLDNPVYAYTDTGSMTVALIVNNNGCKDTLVKINEIYVNPPKADFTYTPAVSCSVPFAVSFTNTSDVPTSPAMNYAWTFNMGASNITSSLFTPPNQNYPPAGTAVYPATFPVKLVVTDPQSGCADSVIRDITVGQPSSDFTIAVPTVC
ncbi:MAG: PKD domain-containing protein, partial [Bacteroidia bacterium]